MAQISFMKLPIKGFEEIVRGAITLAPKVRVLKGICN